MSNGVNATRTSSLESTNAAASADAASKNAPAGTPPDAKNDGSLSQDSLSKSDKKQPSLSDVKDNPPAPQPSMGDATEKKPRLDTLSPEHLSDPGSIDLTTVRQQYKYKALADAQKSVQENHAAIRNKIARLTVSNKNLKDQLLEHIDEKSDLPKLLESSDVSGLKGPAREIAGRYLAVNAKLNSHIADEKTLGENSAKLNDALTKHSPMRTKVLGPCSGHFQSGIGVMNTAFLLLSIPSMFQMVKSFFPSSDKADDQMPAPPPPPQSSAQSFQPRGIVNHQANLMRQQQQQMSQLPPSLQSAFLQGPVSSTGSAQYPQYAQ